MIFGYTLKQLNKFGLYEMKEISIEAPSKTLRRIASFLDAMADKMDNDQFKTCSHFHISDFYEDWRKEFPNKDIIVLDPEREYE